MGDFVVIAILLTVVALVVRGMVRSRKRGGCAGCSGCSRCARQGSCPNCQSKRE